MNVYDLADASTERIRTPEGYLKVPAVIGRSGIQEYRAGEVGHPTLPADTMVKVYRPPEEVFARESMASFGMKPVTNDHPTDLVNAENISDLQIGFSSDWVSQDGDLMRTILIITDPAAIKDIEEGKRELSNGYEAEYEFTAGKTPEGDAYDAIQRNMRGNHIALVEAGRCGGACAVADEENDMAKVKKIKVGGKEYTPAELKKFIADAGHEEKPEDTDDPEEIDDEEEETEDEEEEETDDEGNPFTKGEKDSASGLRRKLARVTAKFDTLKAKNNKASDARTLTLLVSKRSSVTDTARRLFPKVVIAEDTSNIEIQRAVVAELCADCDVSDKSDDYIEARFDGLGEGGGEANRFAERNFTDDNGGRREEKSVTEVARDSYMAELSGRWQPREDKKSA